MKVDTNEFFTGGDIASCVRACGYLFVGSLLISGYLFSFASPRALADSEFSTAGLDPAGYGAAATGYDPTVPNEENQAYKVSQSPNRAMPVESNFNDTTNQTIARTMNPKAGYGGVSGSVLQPVGNMRSLAATWSTLDKVYGGKRLPPTETGSFVAASGFSDAIYGDEGDLFPPTASDFATIGSGIHSKNLTTGHKSNLPSAWGTPVWQPIAPVAR
jgi:hypothetical protein